MDDSKNKILVAIVVFCLVVIVFQMFFNSGDKASAWLKMFGGLMLAWVARQVGAYAVGGCGVEESRRRQL